MPLKFNSYQAAMFLRQVVRQILMACLFCEFAIALFGIIISMDRFLNIDLDSPKFYSQLTFITAFIPSASRFLLTMPIVSLGYFTWNFWKELISISYIAPFLSPQKKINQTIIALIIVFLLSLFITLLPASLNYLKQSSLKTIKDFLKQWLFFLVFTSSISLSAIIYGLQFFFRNTALTWAINILLLIFPISPILFFLCRLILGF